MSRNFYKAALIVFFVLQLQLAGIGSCRQLESMRLDPDNPVVLECWHYYNGVQENSFNKLVSTFNDTVGQEQGIKVMAFSKGGVDELASQIMTAANSAAGNPGMPDVFATYADTACDLIRQNRLVALDSYLPDSELADFEPDFLNEGRLLNNGQLYILPLAKASEAIAVNLTAWQDFAAENPRFADPVVTFANWESIGLASDAYYRWSDGESMIGFDSLANFMIVGCRQLGIDLLQTADGKGQINLDREALHRIWDIYYTHTVLGGFAEFGKFRTDDIKSGQLIAGVVSTSAGPYLPFQVNQEANIASEIDLQVLSYPVFKDAARVCVQQGAGLAVCRSSETREVAAVLFLDWLTRPEQNVSFAVEASYLPVTESALKSQLLRDNLDALGAASPAKTGTQLCLNAFLFQLQDYQLYYPNAFSGSYEIRSLLADSLKNAARTAHLSWLGELKSGISPDNLHDRYINEAVFEQWYSQLVLQAGQLMDQN